MSDLAVTSCSTPITYLVPPADIVVIFPEMSMCTNSRGRVDTRRLEGIGACFAFVIFHGTQRTYSIVEWVN